MSRLHIAYILGIAFSTTIFLSIIVFFTIRYKNKNKKSNHYIQNTENNADIFISERIDEPSTIGLYTITSTILNDDIRLIKIMIYRYSKDADVFIPRLTYNFHKETDDDKYIGYDSEKDCILLYNYDANNNKYIYYQIYKDRIIDYNNNQINSI